jgi:hypothetical protein
VMPGIHRRIMKSLPFAMVFFLMWPVESICQWIGWRAEGKILTGNCDFYHQFANVSVVNFPSSNSMNIDIGWWKYGRYMKFNQ